MHVLTRNRMHYTRAHIQSMMTEVAQILERGTTDRLEGLRKDARANGLRDLFRLHQVRTLMGSVSMGGLPVDNHGCLRVLLLVDLNKRTTGRRRDGRQVVRGGLPLGAADHG